MNGSEQADRTARAAAATLEAIRVDLDPAGVDLDRLDLARLLAAIGAAWNAVEKAHRVSTNERFRWSAACAISNRIAERWENEAALAGSEPADTDDAPGILLEFLRRSH